MNVYEHTQAGWLIRIILGLTALGMVTAWWLDPGRPVPLLFGVGLTAVVLLLFHSLTVCVDREHLRLRFGVGLIRFRYALADIEKARRVRNHWYYGWGIRQLPEGWLFNVSGRDAIEISLASGVTHRVGTDDPDGLLLAIQPSSASRSPR